MSGVVIAEYELPGAVHILVNVGQAINSNLNVYEFPQMEKGAINKVNLTAYKTFMSAALIIGYVGRLDHRASVEDLMHLLEVSFDQQYEHSPRCLPFHAAALASDTLLSIQRSPKSLET